MERTTTFDEHSNSMPLPLPSSIFSHLPVGPFYANLITQQFGAAMKSTALQPVRDGNAARSRLNISSTASVSSLASTVKASNRDMTIVSARYCTVVPTSQIEGGNRVTFHPFHGRSFAPGAAHSSILTIFSITHFPTADLVSQSKMSLQANQSSNVLTGECQCGVECTFMLDSAVVVRVPHTICTISR